MEVGELAPGLWWWTARHPDWEPDHGWDADVRCFYAEAEDATLVLDPLVPGDEAERFWSALDADVERRGVPVAVLLTQAAHARSAGDVARRYDGAIWGHEAAREKVGDAVFHSVSAGDSVPAGRVLEFDQEPEGSGTPLYLPSHRAVAVGDVFLTVDGELRAWWGSTHAGGPGWYEDRARPALRRWLELPIDHVLISHGEQLAGGAQLIAGALERAPYEVD